MVARLPRTRFIPVVYHFFVANIAIFWLLLTLDVERVIVSRVFFVWISVFVLFAVSVFWSLMADLYSPEQGKRLFAFIAAGGSLGALAGPALTIGLAGLLGPVNLLIVAALFLEIAVLCVWRLESASPMAEKQILQESNLKALGGGSLDGIMMVLRSPYLAGIMLWVSLLSVAATFLYFEQARIVAAASDDPAVRTRIFASVDLAVAVLAAAPMLAVVIAFQALQRTANFAISNPAREALFTVVTREEKYKAKNVIDIVAVRGADAADGWLHAALRSLGIELRAISLVAIPLAAAWLVLALTLGRAQERRAAQATGSRCAEGPAAL